MGGQPGRAWWAGWVSFLLGGGSPASLLLGTPLTPSISLTWHPVGVRAPQLLTKDPSHDLHEPHVLICKVGTKGIPASQTDAIKPVQTCVPVVSGPHCHRVSCPHCGVCGPGSEMSHFRVCFCLCLSVGDTGALPPGCREPMGVQQSLTH